MADALDAASLRPEDAGAVELARRYAALIDLAATSWVYVRHLRNVGAALSGASAEAHESFQRIADALGAHSVASDLGPKLLATLTALGLTPAGRGAKGGAPRGGPVASPLDELLQRRQQRRG